MSLRSVRLDEETEKALQEVVQATGLSASSALKQGLVVLRRQLGYQAKTKPYEVYARLDLGPGGYARFPSSETRKGVHEAVRRKLGR